MMRSCSSRHRASAIAECMRGVQVAEGRRRFQFCIERFQRVRRLFLATWPLSTLAFSQLSVGTHGQPRSRVPDSFEASEIIPFPGADSIFSIVAAPFPGGSFLTGVAGARRSLGERQPPRPPRRRAKIMDETCGTLLVYRKQTIRDSVSQKQLLQESVTHLFLF
jgi:hypothetical protein